jgi:hypothetical protein
VRFDKVGLLFGGKEGKAQLMEAEKYIAKTTTKKKKKKKKKKEKSENEAERSGDKRSTVTKVRIEIESILFEGTSIVKNLKKLTLR